MWLALAATGLASAIGFNVLALVANRWTPEERASGGRPISTDEEDVGGRRNVAGCISNLSADRPWRRDNDPPERNGVATDHGRVRGISAWRV